MPANEIPKEIKDAITSACLQFGTTTLIFSYGLFGIILILALIVLAVYQVISWIVALVVIILLILAFLGAIMLYQSLVGKTISDNLNNIKIPNIADYIGGLIPKPSIPPIIPNLPNIPIKPMEEEIQQLHESIED